MVWCPWLCQGPQVVSQASQHFRSSEKQATCESGVALPGSLSARAFLSPFTPAYTGPQYTHRTRHWVFKAGWMSTTSTDIPAVSLGFPFHFSLFVASRHWICRQDRMKACSGLVVGWLVFALRPQKSSAYHVRDGSPGRPPQLSHSSWALMYGLGNDCHLLRHTPSTASVPAPSSKLCQI